MHSYLEPILQVVKTPFAMHFITGVEEDSSHGESLPVLPRSQASPDAIL
jgi:hypothetical protein